VVGLVGDGDEGAGAGLGEAVALDDAAAHRDAEEVFDVARERRAAGDDEAHAAAEARLDLGEDELVEDRGGAVVRVAGLQVVELAREAKVVEEARDGRAGVDLQRLGRNDQKIKFVKLRDQDKLKDQDVK
jgi:hypothetical protein